MWMPMGGLPMRGVSRSGTRVRGGVWLPVALVQEQCLRAASEAMEGREQLWVHTHMKGSQRVGEWGM